MSKEDMKKAVSAGYDTVAPESHGDNVENIEAATQTQQKPEAQEQSAEQVADQKPVEKEVKFADGLFKPFKLGSTLEQSPDGNVMSNFKKPAMDYVEAAKNTKNQVLTSKELAELRNKK